MGCKSVLLCAFSLGIIYFVKSSSAQYYQYADLENSCNGSLLLECPYPETGRAGTFRYYYPDRLPPGLCSFEVALAPNCGNFWDSYAIYLNIRKFDLPSTDYLKILENGFFPLKHFNGSQPATTNPRSVAQAKTLYSKQPHIVFEYFRSTSPASNYHDALIDFVIVEERADSHNTYCQALLAYVNNVFICDTDGSADRVNCPSNYQDVLFEFDATVLNPAYGRQCSNQSTTQSWAWNTTTFRPATPTTAAANTTSFRPPVTAAPVELPSYLVNPLNITCRLGRVNLPEPNLDLVDAVTTIFDGDNTLNCRVILHDLHSWIVAKLGETRQKRTSFYEPIKVECTRGNLTISNVDPGTSESTGLVFRTGGSKKCIDTYREFSDYVTSFAQTRLG
ncbi:uncharacterized protein LOC129596483 [Paramacrobiotus metropolitanus]|uniref:uncharacterized protein LOC129596483 n=1 Tax=Paramacrobiotus metropolitanus TaxID=2943436 RepID=UPI00244584D0|nr:uncharacterized protein LOC129596483 [Paramacrobiotus metropolitanus]